MEETDPEDRSDADITAVMRDAAKAKAASFRGKFSKYTAVANPKLGDQFLLEVQHCIRNLHTLDSLYLLLIQKQVL